MLASLNSQCSLRSAVGLNAFKPQDNLLCRISLIVENQLSLLTITTLLPVITLFSLHIQILLARSRTVTLWVDACHTYYRKFSGF